MLAENQRKARALILLLLLTLAVINLVPWFYAVLTSFKEKIEFVKNMFGLPATFYFDNYLKLATQEQYPRYIFNSVLLTASSTAVALVVASLAAYALVLGEFRGKAPLFDFIVALMAVPPIVLVVPLFVEMSALNLVNTYAAPIIIYVGFIIPFSIFILSGYFSSLPKELIDAALVDGASPLQTLFRIVLPLAKPPLLTLAVINGLWVWNELLIALLFLQKNELRTLMVSLSFHRGKDMQDVPVIMAGAVLASLPTLALVGVAQRFIVRGFLGGAVKG